MNKGTKIFLTNENRTVNITFIPIDKRCYLKLLIKKGGSRNEKDDRIRRVLLSMLYETLMSSALIFYGFFL